MANQIDSLLAQLYYENKPRVKSDTVALCSQFKSLVPKVSTLIHNDGMETQNLMLDGTIPIFFQGVQYNIPVDIYISSRHPLTAPKVFVRPTSNMIVKPGHQCVDMDGMVCFQYISSWQNTSGSSGASLVEMVQIMSTLFSQEPPLFTRPKATSGTSSSSSSGNGYVNTTSGYNNNTAYNGAHANAANGYSYNAAVATNTTTTNHHHNTNNSPYAYAETMNTNTTANSNNNGANLPAASVTLINNTNATMTTATYATPTAALSPVVLNGIVIGGGGGGGKGNNVNSMNNSNHSNNSNVNNTNKHSISARYLQLQHDVTLKLQRELFDVHSKLKTEIDDEFYTQALLQSSYDNTIQKGNQLMKLKTDLSEILQEIDKKSQLLQEWTAVQKQEKIKKLQNDETDTASRMMEKYIDAYDGVSNQLIRLYAEQKTYNDIIYYLEKAKQQQSNTNNSNSNTNNDSNTTTTSSNKELINTSSFLKQIRMYAKKEFLCRMHILKINQTISSSSSSSSSSTLSSLQQQQQQQQQSMLNMNYASQQQQQQQPARTNMSMNHAASFNSNQNSNNNNNSYNTSNNSYTNANANANDGLMYSTYYNSDHYNINSLPLAPAPQKPLKKKT